MTLEGIVFAEKSQKLNYTKGALLSDLLDFGGMGFRPQTSEWEIMKKRR